jgi:hypothetical protein
MIWRVIPAINDGSPSPRRWFLGMNQFQHLETFAARGCAG